MQVLEAVVLLAGVFLVNQETSAMPRNSQGKDSKAHSKEDTARSRLSFNTPSENFIHVRLGGSRTIDCSVVDSENVEFHLFYTPALSQTPQERALAKDKLTLNNGVYALMNVEALDYGHYYCSAQREKTMIRKDFAIVPAREPVVFTPVLTPQSASITYGDDLTVSCTCWAKDCKLTGKVDLLFGKAEGYEFETKSFSVQDHYSKVELIMKLVNLNTHLTVFCTSKYGDKESTSSVSVSVEGKPPQILQLPTIVSVNSGSDKEILCNATGLPEVTIWWTHGYHEIKDCTSDKESRGCDKEDSNYRLLGPRMETLKILKASEQNSGLYGCHAMNTYGMAEKIVNVKVLGTENTQP